jgi:hypothetical protein
MEPEELLEGDPEMPVDFEAEEWDEETLGLDVDDYEAETIAREIGLRH